MTDPISDLAIRIKNGFMARREEIEVPYSKYRKEVLEKLSKLGYIDSYEVIDLENNKKTISVRLSYTRNNSFTDVKIFSTPGRRWYVPKNELKPVVGGMGYAIISTSKGILTNVEAKKMNIGGELLFYIW